MIFVTVGMHNQGFDRLLEPMDKLANELDEKVIIQRGFSSYLPQNAEQFQWTSGQHMEQLTGEARVVVTHAAAGAIIIGLKLGKPLVVAPRLKRFNEHVDDHQEQLAKALSEKSWAAAIWDLSVDGLRSAIGEAFEQQQGQRETGANSLVQALQHQLTEWS